MIITYNVVAEKQSSYFETIIENLDLQNKAESLADNDLNDIIRNFLNLKDLKEGPNVFFNSYKEIIFHS